MKKHPKLKEKFQLLYLLKLNPQIKNNVHLGNALGKTKQSISRWCVGTPTSRGNCIPAEDTEIVAGIFQIPHEWFSLAFEEFEKNVRGLLEARRNPQSSAAPELSIAALPITTIEIIGRQEELLFLDSCWNDPRTNVVEIVAFGGTGKSSLINYWLSELSKLYYRNAEKIYAWSFSWQEHSSNSDSSGDYFMEHALSWFGDENPASGTPWAKATRLANLIRSSRTLLILDGLEPLQYPPGQKHGEVENPAVSFLIRELAAGNTGLLVITTRYSVTDLGAFNDGRVEKLQLSNLSENSGIELLKNRGVTGSSDEFKRVVHSYAGHPLSLLLIAGYLTTVYKGALENLSPVHSIIDENHQESHVARIMSGYVSWLADKPGLQALQMVSLVARSISLADLKILVSRDEIAGLTDRIINLSGSDWAYCIKDLEAANLLACEDVEGSDSLECHPLIKDFMTGQLKNMPAMVMKGHELIYKFYRTKALQSSNNEIGQELLYRAVIHAVHAGMHSEGFELYYKYLKKGYIIPQGSHSIDLNCITVFFGGNLNNEPASLGEEAVYFLLASAATNLMSLGRLQESIDLTFKCLNFYRENEKWMEILMAAGPLVSMLITAGDLKKAISVLDSLAQQIELIGNPVLTAMAKNFRAYICHLNGNDADAERHFKSAEQVLNSHNPGVEVEFPIVSSYYCKFLLDRGEVHKALERSLRTFDWRGRNTWQVAIDTTSILAADLLVLGLAFLETGDTANARIQINKQIEILRSADECLYLPAGLNSRARLHRALGDLKAATKDLEESLQISQRTGAKFGEWEACLDLAHLSVQKNDLASASGFLDQTKSIPDMDSYKFRDKEIQELESRLSINQKIA